MRKIQGVALGTAVAILAAPAMAADLGTVVVDTPPVSDTAPYSVTGFYAGMNFGRAFTGAEYDDDAFDPAQIYDFSDESLTGGVSLGYDTQLGSRLVGGVELRYDYLNAKFQPFVLPLSGDIATIEDSVSLTGKLGYLAAPGTQIYGVLGVGSVGVSMPVGFFDDRLTGRASGYVVGVGAETMITDAISASVDARYFQATDWFDNTQDGLHVRPKYLAVTAGLKYRFGGSGVSEGDFAETDFNFSGFNASLALLGAAGSMDRPVMTAGAVDGPFWGSGFGVSGGIGYDFALNDTFVFGLQASIDYDPITFEDPDQGSPDVDGTTEFASVDGVIQAGVKVGAKISPSSLLYATAGIARIQTNANADFFALAGGGSEMLKGYQVGVGLESALTDKLTLDISGTYTAATETLVTDNAQYGQVELQPTILAAKVGLKYHF